MAPKKIRPKETPWSSTEDGRLHSYMIDIANKSISIEKVAELLNRDATDVRWRIKVLKVDDDKRNKADMSAKEIETFHAHCRQICQYYMFHIKDSGLHEARKRFFIPTPFFQDFFFAPDEEDLKYIRGFQKAYDHFCEVFGISKRPVLEETKEVSDPSESDTDTTMAVQNDMEQKDENEVVTIELSKQRYSVLNAVDYMDVAAPLVSMYNSHIRQYEDLVQKYEAAKEMIAKLHSSLKELKKEQYILD